MSVNAILVGQSQKIANIDAIPTEGSNNPVSSGGTKSALDEKQDKIAYRSITLSAASRQVDAFEKAGVDPANIYTDKQSGKDFNRPNYQALIDKVQQGSLIIIKSIDRLGRDYSEILEQWQYLTKTKGIDIQVLDMPLLDTAKYKDLLGTFVSDLVLQILSFQAEQERTYIKQRQAEGIEAARQKEIKFGRPRKPLPANFDELYERYLHNEPIYRLAKDCPGISESTLRLRIYERQTAEADKTN